VGSSIPGRAGKKKTPLGRVRWDVRRTPRVPAPRAEAEWAGPLATLHEPLSCGVLIWKLRWDSAPPPLPLGKGRLPGPAAPFSPWSNRNGPPRDRPAAAVHVSLNRVVHLSKSRWRIPAPPRQGIALLVGSSGRGGLPGPAVPFLPAVETNGRGPEAPPAPALRYE